MIQIFKDEVPASWMLLQTQRGIFVITKRIPGFYFYLLFLLSPFLSKAQARWTNVDSLYGPLPTGFKVFKLTDSLDGRPFRAFYISASLKNKQLIFDTDTSQQRRLTPTAFYKKNSSPLLVVNSTFFSFATHQNLNLVIKAGKIVSYNVHSIAGKGKDTLTYRHPFNAAIGISKNRKADVAWVYSDSSNPKAWASQVVFNFSRDSVPQLTLHRVRKISHSLKLHTSRSKDFEKSFQKWNVRTAVAGGPALLQHGKVNISNNEELKFAGKAINDLHPRTLMGYTKNGELIIMVIEGRNPGIASGASLVQAASLMQSVGCVEALNLDGGGSTCMLINGKETVWPSDKGQQRAIPGVFIIREK
jgi:hypothetical protein